MTQEEKKILKDRVRLYEELESKLPYLKKQKENMELAKLRLEEAKKSKGDLPKIEVRVPYRGSYQYCEITTFEPYSEAGALINKEIMNLKFEIQRVNNQLKDLQ